MVKTTQKPIPEYTATITLVRRFPPGGISAAGAADDTDMPDDAP